MLSPWLFNPNALTAPSVAASFREWRLWVDGATGDIKVSHGSWRKWHAERLKMVRASPISKKLLLGAEAIIPKFMIFAGCAAYLRDSPSLEQHGPSDAVLWVLLGGFVLTVSAPPRLESSTAR